MPLPKLSSNEAAEYFDTHSMAEMWDILPESQPVRLSKAWADKIRKRHASVKSPISIRLAVDRIAAAKKIAAAESVGYQTQLRMWIAEGIRREAKRASIRADISLSVPLRSDSMPSFLRETGSDAADRM